MPSQAPLSSFHHDASETAGGGWPLYRFECTHCDERFLSLDIDSVCQNCGRQHPQNRGFLGDAALASAVEQLDDLGVHPQMLDVQGAVAVLNAAGEPVPDAVTLGERRES
jgi:hypothetical protein